MNSVYDYIWHDSDIESIEIKDRSVCLLIFQEITDKKMMLRCEDVIGISNICMWEDTTIFDLELNIVQNIKDEFLKEIYCNHPDTENYDKPFKENLFDLAITLTNDMTFHIYCYHISVIENNPLN